MFGNWWNTFIPCFGQYTVDCTNIRKGFFKSVYSSLDTIESQKKLSILDRIFRRENLCKVMMYLCILTRTLLLIDLLAIKKYWICRRLTPLSAAYSGILQLKKWSRATVQKRSKYAIHPNLWMQVLLRGCRSVVYFITLLFSLPAAGF